MNPPVEPSPQTTILCSNPRCARPLAGGITVCPSCGRRTAAGDPDDRPSAANGYLVINTALRKRLLGWSLYVLAFAVIAGILAYLFFAMAGSWRLAVLLVGFMLLYMIGMGIAAARNIERRE